MKSFALTLGALATLVAAQDISGLPECGQFCANDMLTGQASDLGCSENDITCVCQNVNFVYGLRDCSDATCDSDDARQIVEFGIALCRDNGVEITTANPSPTASGSGSSSASVSTVLSTVTTPVDTTTLGSETPSSTSGAGELTSTVTSDGTTLTTTLTTASSDAEETGDSETSTDSGDGAEETTDEDGAAMPQRTMAPVGVLAAGLAVLLL